MRIELLLSILQLRAIHRTCKKKKRETKMARCVMITLMMRMALLMPFTVEI